MSGAMERPWPWPDFAGGGRGRARGRDGGGVGGGPDRRARRSRYLRRAEGDGKDPAPGGARGPRRCRSSAGRRGRAQGAGAPAPRRGLAPGVLGPPHGARRGDREGSSGPAPSAPRRSGRSPGHARGAAVVRHAARSARAGARRGGLLRRDPCWRGELHQGHERRPEAARHLGAAVRDRRRPHPPPDQDLREVARVEARSDPGNGTITQRAREILWLGRTEDEWVLEQLAHNRRRGAPDGTTWRFRVEDPTGDVVRVVPAAHGVEEPEARAEVNAVLVEKVTAYATENPGHTTPEVAKALGRNKDAVAKALAQAQREGRLDRRPKQTKQATRQEWIPRAAPEVADVGEPQEAGPSGGPSWW